MKNLKKNKNSMYECKVKGRKRKIRVTSILININIPSLKYLNSDFHYQSLIN